MDSIQYISCIRFSIQLLMAETVFLIGSPRRERFGLRLVVAAAAYTGLSGGWFLLLKQLPGDGAVLKIFFWMGLFILSMGAIFACFDLLPVELVFVGTGGYATEHIAYTVAKILQYLSNGYEPQIGVFRENLIFRFLIYVLIDVGMYLFIVRKNREKGEIKKGDTRLVHMAFLILFSAIILSVYASEETIVPQRSVLSEVICPMYSFLCCMLVILLEYYVFRENRLSREKETMEQLLQMADAQQRSSKEAIDIINVKCHDLKHQMKALTRMEGEKERSEYIEEMRRAVSIYDATYHTGCEALDYVLREKNLLCDEYGVAFSCMADGTVINSLHAADIYALMGNALDNALECVAQEKAGERIISLRINRHGQMVSIHLENTCSQPPQFVDGLPVTKKPDKHYHGFGVQSIRYITRKYQGEVLMRAQSGRFYLDILLPAQQN